MQPSHNTQMGRFFPIFDRIAVAAIGGYQRHLSPHKGFSCAHRVLYGDLSCSEYVKHQIQAAGLARGIVMARQRFAACREANQILRSQWESNGNIQSRSRKKRFWRDNCGSGCTYWDCSGCDCGDVALPELDCGDFGDCGNSIDCCSGGDCGSCG